MRLWSRLSEANSRKHQWRDQDYVQQLWRWRTQFRHLELFWGFCWLSSSQEDFSTSLLNLLISFHFAQSDISLEADCAIKFSRWSSTCLLQKRSEYLKWLYLHNHRHHLLTLKTFLRNGFSFVSLDSRFALVEPHWKCHSSWCPQPEAFSSFSCSWSV